MNKLNILKKSIMKPFFLFIFIFIMITIQSANVSATITIYTPDEPDFNVSVESGGSLPEDTNFCFVGFWSYGSGYYGASVSPASEQKCVVTDSSNRSIKMSWGDTNYSGFDFAFKWDMNHSLIDENTGEYYNWFSESFPTNAYGHVRWSKRYLGESSCSQNDSILMNSINDSSLHASCGLWDGESLGSTYYKSQHGHPQIAWAYESHGSPNINVSEIGFNKNVGTPLVVIRDSNHTYDDLVSAIESQNKQEYFNYSDNDLSTMGMFHTESDGALYLENLNINMYQGEWDTSQFWFRNCNILLLGYSRWHRAFGNFYFTSVKHNGGVMTIQGVDDKFYFSPGHFSGATGTPLTIYASKLGGFFQTGYAINNSGFQYRYPASHNKFTNSSFSNSRMYMTYGGITDVNTYFENMTWDNPGLSEDILLGVNYIYDAIGTDYDLNLICNNCKSLSSDNGLPVISITHTPSEWLTNIDLNYFFYYDLDIKVTDVNGIPINNANVLIYDNENKKYTGSTDENGNLMININAYNGGFFESDNQYMQFKSNNPFNIEISADDYDTYKTVQTISSSQEWTITLPQEVTLIMEERKMIGELMFLAFMMLGVYFVLYRRGYQIYAIMFWGATSVLSITMLDSASRYIGIFGFITTIMLTIIWLKENNNNIFNGKLKF